MEEEGVKKRRGGFRRGGEKKSRAGPAANLSSFVRQGGEGGTNFVTRGDKNENGRPAARKGKTKKDWQGPE